MAQLALFGATPRVASPSPEPLRSYAIPIYRVTLVREAALPFPAPQMRGSTQAVEVVRRYLTGVDREHFVVLLLDQKHRITGINTVAVGSLTAATVHPREVMKAAIVHNAAALICAHNHPSGDPTPSREDRQLTTRLVAAGQLLGIPVLDHVIVGDGSLRSYSFADAGALV